MIDLTSQITEVERRVGSRNLEAGEGRVVTISKVFASDVEDLWDACTSPERLPRWFLPVTGELRLGGKYQLEGNAGGTVERCDPPNSFSATWEYDGSVSWIEVRLTATADDQVRFELEHVMPVDDHWNMFGPGATGCGWDTMLVGFGLHLATGQAVDPVASEAWFGSAEGKQFLTASGNAWAAADIANGADPEEARIAADKTIGFYTAAPDQA
jgi:uncharacterized protein YndB with AHSA1/START domain